MGGAEWSDRLDNCFQVYTRNMRGRLSKLQPTRELMSSDGIGRQVVPPTPEEWADVVSGHVDCVGVAILDQLESVTRRMEQINVLNRLIEIDEINVQIKVKEHAERSTKERDFSTPLGDVESVHYITSEDIQDSMKASAMVLARKKATDFPPLSEKVEALLTGRRVEEDKSVG